MLRHDKRPVWYCQACDKSFEPKRIDARFCSLACKQRAYRRRLSSVSASAGAFIVVALMLWPTVALAQQTRETFKDASGRTLGSATTDARGNTVYRDSMARNTGRSVTSRGTTTFNDRMGRQTGTAKGR